MCGIGIQTLVRLETLYEAKRGLDFPETTSRLSRYGSNAMYLCGELYLATTSPGEQPATPKAD